jgi:PAS domain S-box-containing protein
MDREFYRLQAVERFKKLEPGIENDLSDIVNLAAQICNSPVALITLLDKDIQWFKYAKGTDVTHTPRELSFCNYTIQQTDVLIVSDAQADERTKNNPLVASDPNIRFYAGAPLITKEGFGIGSLCVVDFEAKELDDHQKYSLKVLSKQVMNLMELNWNLHALAEQNEQSHKHKQAIETSQLKLRAFFDSTTDIHILLNKDMEIMAYNKSAARYIYNIYQQEVAVGDRMLNYVDTKMKHHITKFIAIALKGKVIRHELLVRPGTVYECWREIKLMPIKNNEGEIFGIAINSHDISKRKQQEKQISIQNEALTRIAIIQSHELRRPVASLLGMMDLMKMEQIDFGYFNMMEITVNELDKKIRIIVEDSEKTINSHLSIVA